LQLNLEGANEFKAVGIAKLMADFDKTISLTPADNERIERRNSKDNGD
jgi:lysine 2,3-aminomutase